MRKIYTIAAGIACLMGAYLLGTASGDPVEKTTLPELPHKVGLIDLGYVFEKSSKLTMLRDDLKEELQGNEEKGRLLVQRVQTLQGELKGGTIKEGSAEYTERERELTQKVAEFEAFRKQAQTEMSRKEAKVFHTVHQEILDVVDRYAQHYQYTLILRFNRNETVSSDPQKLAQTLNRQVVFSRTEDDLSDRVVDYMNKKYEQAKGAGPAEGRTTKKPATTGTRTK